MNIEHERKLFEAAHMHLFTEEEQEYAFRTHGNGRYIDEGLQGRFDGWLAKAETVPVDSIAFAESELDTQWSNQFYDARANIYAKHRDALRAFLGVEP